MLKVLTRKKQILDARKCLKENGISFLDGGFLKLLRKIGCANGISIGDQIKSWDVNETVEFIKDNFPPKARILDLGAYCSELPVCLYKTGYIKVSGIDVNQNISKMPFSNSVNYVCGDFLESNFQDSSFDIVTSISVIEHGYNSERLFSEMSRIIADKGYFVASFDYWPDKIDTGEIKFFDMDWLIFSKEDVEELLATAKKYGFVPVGDLEYGADEKAVSCAGKEYTFGWIALRKGG